MDGIVGKVLDKIAIYEILNNIVPGAIFMVLADKYTQFELQKESLIVNIVLSYFAGLVISCIGSVLIEPVLKHKNRKGKSVIEFAPYDDYVNAEKNDDTGRLRQLSAVNNMYRTLFSTMLCLLMAVGINYVRDLIVLRLEAFIAPVSYASFAILFLLAYCKQTGYVKKRVNNLKQKSIEAKLEKEGTDKSVKTQSQKKGNKK